NEFFFYEAIYSTMLSCLLIPRLPLESNFPTFPSKYEKPSPALYFQAFSPFS
ncbi:MAG: hypothetical protein ACI8XB_002992, partial [Patiriisocius sp.]